MITNNCEHFANMAVLGINFSKQADSRREEFEIKNGLHRQARIMRTVGGLFLAPITGGASLGPTALGVKDWIDKEQNGDFKINNDKVSINLRNEINKTRTEELSTKSDYETRELETRVEQAIPSYIPTDSCRIM